MFDISFTELLVIGSVALVVLGPEKLPKVARTVGHLVGRLQRYVSDVKRDINREMELEELRNLRAQMDEAAREVNTSIRKHTDDIQGEFDDAARAIKPQADDAARPVAGVSVAPEADTAPPVPEGAAMTTADDALASAAAAADLGQSDPAQRAAQAATQVAAPASDSAPAAPVVPAPAGADSTPAATPKP
ncbi:twin-arginine translocase subunit TatB [Achromobacter sp. GG226]|uniref:Sec-independent protein translocase protein TatB n=1 Tax=Verticiella alkaliphila TaxID=2779529 RepID=UPI001C0E2C1F|nr:Sec-independent protein translocase protein TatB [Verticiella sp. GG226]MBU4610358.1 twin-arginine translocase subunit TatB [Verticiella sp. GG226]